MMSQSKLAIVFGFAVAGAAAPAFAQTLPSGPVAAQADVAPTRATAARKTERGGTRSAATAKRKTPAKSADGKAEAKASEPWMAVDPGRAARPAGVEGPLAAEPKSVVSHYGTNEPLEIGGKWSGSNDTAEKTRADNYNANAAGSGGEVGLKLHF